MSASLSPMFWKEWRELQRSRSGLAGRLAGIFLPLAVMGALLPWQFGPAWVQTPVGLGFWCWVSLLMVTPQAADSIAGERERHTLDTLLALPISDGGILFGKVGAATLYGWVMGTATALLSLVTINLTHWEGAIRLYPTTLFLGGLLLSGLSALLGSSAGLLLSMRSPTVRQAQQSLSLVVLLLALGPLIASLVAPPAFWTRLPGMAGHGAFAAVFPLLALALGLIDLFLLLVATRRFRRHLLLRD